MNRYLTCLLFAGLLRADLVAFALSLPSPTRSGRLAITDTLRAGGPGWALVIGDIQALRSTHDNYFLGGSIMVARPFSRTVELGIGVEVSHARYHPDNGWQLHHLYFIPLFVATRFNLVRKRKTTVYLQTDQGVSLAHYQKQDGKVSQIPYGVTEYGYYGYAGGSIRWQVIRHVLIQVETGMKSFHLSTNELTVNPHGLTLRLGVVVR